MTSAIQITPAQYHRTRLLAVSVIGAVALFVAAIASPAAAHSNASCKLGYLYNCNLGHTACVAAAEIACAGHDNVISSGPGSFKQGGNQSTFNRSLRGNGTAIIKRRLRHR